MRTTGEARLEELIVLLMSELMDADECLSNNLRDGILHLFTKWNEADDDPAAWDAYFEEEMTRIGWEAK